MADTLLKSSWTSTIFQGRNTAYGAYELRGLYNKNINRALIISVVLFSLAISAPLIMSYLNIGAGEKEENVEINLELLPPPPIDPNQPPPPPPPKIEVPKLAAAVKFLPPKVEDDEKVQEEEPPTVDEMKDKQISTENREGEKTEVDVIQEAAPVIEEKQEEVFLFAEEMPEFEGGAAAMMKFIRSKIEGNYPRQAQNEGIEGRVVITFVVGSSGEIENVEVAKGIGGGCDELAASVVKSMPKWKPGKQNGRAVKVKYTLPIKFSLGN